MPATYRVLIEPDEDENDAILEILLSEGHTEEQAKRILELGGTVAEHLELEGAEDLRDHLVESGAVARIEPMERRQQDDEDSKTFIVSGTVRSETGEVLEGKLVRAFDVGLRGEQQLGRDATVNANGSYHISYTLEEFQQSEGERPDIVVRVYNEVGTQLAESDEIIYNAEEDVEVDFSISLETPIQPSRFEIDQDQITSAIDTSNLALEDLNDSDIEFLAGKTGLEESRIQTHVESSAASRETGLRGAVVYAFLDALPDDEEWLDTALGILLEILETYSEENLIPPEIAADESINEIERQLTRLQRGRQTLTRHELRGQLLSDRTGRLLQGLEVKSVNLIGDEGSQDEAITNRVTTDREGRFTVEYLHGEGADTLSIVRLRVFDPLAEFPDDELVYEEEFEPDPTQGDDLQISIPFSEPDTLPLADFATDVGLDLSDELLAALDDQEVRTLADIRRKGGLEGIDVPDGTESEARDVEAYAYLSLVSRDSRVLELLIENEYASIADIADASEAEFVASVVDDQGVVTESKGRQLHFRARVQNRVLSDLWTAVQTAGANSLALETEEVTTND